MVDYTIEVYEEDSYVYEFLVEGGEIADIDKIYSWKVISDGEVTGRDWAIVPTTRIKILEPPGYQKYLDNYSQGSDDGPYPAFGPSDEFARDEQFVWDFARLGSDERAIDFDVKDTDGNILYEIPDGSKVLAERDHHSDVASGLFHFYLTDQPPETYS